MISNKSLEIANNQPYLKMSIKNNSVEVNTKNHNDF